LVKLFVLTYIFLNNHKMTDVEMTGSSLAPAAGAKVEKKTVEEDLYMKMKELES
jgi:hypothetical protein